MSHYILICCVLALLSTVLVNPSLYYWLITSRKRLKVDLEKWKKDHPDRDVSSFYEWNSRRYNLYYKGKLHVSTVIGQISIFILVFIFSMAVLYFLECTVVRFTTVLAYLWIPGIANFIVLVPHESRNTNYERDSEKVMGDGHVILGMILLFIPIIIGLHKGAYKFIYPYDNFTIIAETYEDVPKIDSTTILKEAKLASEAHLKEPIYRNNQWIYPVETDDSHVTSAGYIVVNSDDDITFVSKEINYAPWMTTRCNSKYPARRLMPNAVLLGKQTYQIDPNGDVFFCQVYGDYAFFRAGRVIKGIILIDAKTGQCQSYECSNIPSWITGISF